MSSNNRIYITLYEGIRKLMQITLYLSNCWCIYYFFLGLPFEIFPTYFNTSDGQFTFWSISRTPQQVDLFDTGKQQIQGSF